MRTQQTAAALGRRVITRDELGLSATPETVLRAAGWPDRDDAVVVVGHQPTLGMVAARLVVGMDAPWSVRKGSIWWFAHEEGRTVLRAVLGPELV